MDTSSLATPEDSQTRRPSNTQKLQRDLLFHLTNVRQNLTNSAGSYNGLGGVSVTHHQSTSPDSWRLAWTELHETERIFLADLKELEVLCAAMVKRVHDWVSAEAAKPAQSLLKRVTSLRGRKAGPASSELLLNVAEKLVAWEAMFSPLMEIKLAHRALYDNVFKADFTTNQSEDDVGDFSSLLASLLQTMPTVFPIHGRYSFVLVQSIKTLHELLSDNVFADCWKYVMEEHQAHNLQSGWSIEWALAKPLHRLTKYPLIFNKWKRCVEILKDTQIDRQLRELIDVTHDAVVAIDDEKGREESMDRLKHFSESMSFKNATDIDGKNKKVKSFVYKPYREDGGRRLVLDAQFGLITSAHGKHLALDESPFFFFLLSDQLLIARQASEKDIRKNKLVKWNMLHAPIPLDRVEILSIPNFDQCMF